MSASSLPDRAGLATGWLYDPQQGEFYRGWVRWDAKLRVTATGRGRPPDHLPATVKGIILPRLVNWHTHLGDTVFRERLVSAEAEAAGAVEAAREGPALELAAVVGPGGLKHRWLERLPRERLREGLARGLGEQAAAGVGHVVDFREGGLEGVLTLQEARRAPGLSSGGSGQTTVLGRPGTLEVTSSKLRELLTACDGLGLPALRDLPEDRAREWTAEARRQGKLVALHVSEQLREPLGPVLELSPDLLVHLGAATESDLQLIAQQAGTREAGGKGTAMQLAADRGSQAGEALAQTSVRPGSPPKKAETKDTGSQTTGERGTGPPGTGEGPAVAVCPGSNLRFGAPLADVPRMLELDLQVGLGTDNGMLGPPDLLAELALVARRFPELTQEQLMGVLLAVPKWLYNAPDYPPQTGLIARFGVFWGSGTKPMARLLAPDHRCVLQVGPS